MTSALLDDPALSAAFDAAREDPGHADAAADMLAERRPALGDVLLAFAGPAPRWEGGVPKGVLWRWLKQAEPDNGVTLANVPVRPGQHLKEGQYRRVTRWQAVRSVKEDVQLLAITLATDEELLGGAMLAASYAHAHGLGPGLGRDDPRVRLATKRALAVVGRDLKRRVLGQFPEVEKKLGYEISLEARHAMAAAPSQIADAMRRGGFRLDLPISSVEALETRSYRYGQTLAAPDWIPPEGRAAFCTRTEEHGAPRYEFREAEQIDARWAATRSDPLTDVREAIRRMQRLVGGTAPREDPLAHLGRRIALGCDLPPEVLGGDTPPP